jgi:hypothetical protein
MRFKRCRYAVTLQDEGDHVETIWRNRGDPMKTIALRAHVRHTSARAWACGWKWTAR